MSNDPVIYLCLRLQNLHCPFSAMILSQISTLSLCCVRMATSLLESHFSLHSTSWAERSTSPPSHFLVRAQNRANKKVAKKKVTEMYHSSMRERLESWFALGTHSRRPFSKWMIAGLLWMEKQFDTIFSKVRQKAYLGSRTSH